jgi:hypothetical protein
MLRLGPGQPGRLPDRKNTKWSIKEHTEISQVRRRWKGILGRGRSRCKVRNYSDNDIFHSLIQQVSIRYLLQAKQVPAQVS